MFGDARDESNYTASGMAVPAGETALTGRSAEPSRSGIVPGAGGEEYEENEQIQATEDAADILIF